VNTGPVTSTNDIYHKDQEEGDLRRRAGEKGRDGEVVQIDRYPWHVSSVQKKK
jgi:hypothetical protein